MPPWSSYFMLEQKKHAQLLRESDHGLPYGLVESYPYLCSFLLLFREHVIASDWPPKGLTTVVQGADSTVHGIKTATPSMVHLLRSQDSLGAATSTPCAALSCDKDKIGHGRAEGTAESLAAMASSSHAMKPHAVIFPFPTTGQINPMLELAKLLHHRGFHITFINTRSSSQKILKSGGCDALQGAKHFKFETIPDGYPHGPESPFDILELIMSVEETCPAALDKFLQELKSSSDAPPITCVIGNFLMTFVVSVAEKLSVPLLTFWTTSACSLLGSLQLPELIRRGYTPLKDESCLKNGYLDTTIDWIPGMASIRLKDLSSFIRTTDRDDMYLKDEIEQVKCAMRASGLILNAFDGMEREVLHSLRRFFPRMYTVGPLASLLNQIEKDPMNSTHLSLWEEKRGCGEWLDTQDAASVVYVSFGSLATLTVKQLTEFAWGIAESGHPFLWIIRANLVHGGLAALPEEFIKETAGRSFFASWCNQGEVLSHPAVGGFLTHGGWNSMLESVCSGVPMICWPGFADQYTNCHYACEHWGIAMEIDQEVDRRQVKDLVRELMGGGRGQLMRERAAQWKDMAERAAEHGGSSCADLERLAMDLESLKN